MRQLVLATILFWSATAKSADLDVTDQPIVHLTGVINAPTVVAVRTQLVAAAAKSDDIVLVITSSGGEVIAGIVLINTMHQLQQAGVNIRCVVPVAAMSMAFAVFAECNERWVWDDSLLLFHPMKAAVRASVSASEARDIGKDLHYLEVGIKERMRQRLGVPAKWFNWHYSHETVHRGADLAQQVPAFINLVTSYIGATFNQLIGTKL